MSDRLLESYYQLEEQVLKLQAELQTVKQENERQCKWTPDEDGVYDTECGEKFVLISSDPKGNQMKYCSYCGGKLIDQTLKDGEAAKPK